MKALSSAVRAVSSLSRQELESLYALLASSYEAVSFEQFHHDILAKDDVLVLHDAGGTVQGFSTQVTHHLEIDGASVRVLFSGDTIISPECWGTQELVRAWCRYAGEVLARAPHEPLYWLLLSKGHRTYLYLPLFFLDYVPHPGHENTHLGSLRDDIAARLFGADFKATTGRLEFTSSKGHLRPILAEVVPAKDRHEHVAYFLKCNPRYTEGHELVCLTEISPENMRGTARKHLLHGMGRDITAATSGTTAIAPLHS